MQSVCADPLTAFSFAQVGFQVACRPDPRLIYIFNSHSVSAIGEFQTLYFEAMPGWKKLECDIFL